MGLSEFGNMSVELSIIAEELRRLQRAGQEHVFVDDHTWKELRSGASTAAGVATDQASRNSGRRPDRGTPNEGAVRRGQPAEHADLRALIETPRTGKPTKVPEKTSPPSAELPKSAPKIKLPAEDAQTQLEFLKQAVLACPTCNAHLNPGGQIVFGTGDVSADILFCGEAPGADEEQSGQPFVGKAGQLLDKIISAMGLSREGVYITNILKWRPQHEKPYGNRPPTNEEMQFCLPYLEAQIEVVRPKVIVALGNTAVSGLLGPDPRRKMGSVRGTWAQFKEIPLMITFHPAYLLRNGTLKTKRMIWEDMLKVMEHCELPISERQRGFFIPQQ